MQVPSGVKIIFDGGSFNGALPSLCEIKNSVVVVGTGSNVALTFQDGATLATGSNLALSGGGVSASNATIAGALSLSYASASASGTLTVTGALSSTGNKAFSASTLTRSGAGSIVLNVGAATGTSWTLTSLEAASIEIDALTSSGDVDSEGIAEGTSWNVGGMLTASEAVDIDALTTGGRANLLDSATGSTWNIGAALDVGGDATITTITQAGAATIAGAAYGSDWNVASLEAASADIDALETSGDAQTTNDATGENWTIGGALTVGGAANVDALETTGAANIAGDGSGDGWKVGAALTVGGDATITTITQAGASTITGAASGSDWNVASLEAASADIDELTTTGNVQTTNDANGDNWNVGGALTVGGAANVGALGTTGAANITGNATGSSWDVGALTVGGVFNVPTLTLDGASSVSLANVATLTLESNAVLTIGQDSSITNLASRAGSSMVFSQSFLAVEESASLSSPTNVSGVGYFALPSGAAYSNVVAAQGSDVRVCEYGAGATSLGASVSGSTVTGVPVKTNAARTVLAEVKIDNVWTLIDARAAGSFTTTRQGTNTEIRIFDGASFKYATAEYIAERARVWLVYVNSIAAQTASSYTVVSDYATFSHWTITTDYVMASEYTYAGESILLFARVVNSNTSTLLAQADVSSIKYTCYKRSYAWGKESRTAVTGHNNVTIPNSAILSALVTNDSRWTKDQTGYNFRFEPTTTANPIFPEAGEYIIVVTITPVSGNPAPICYEVSVR